MLIDDPAVSATVYNRFSDPLFQVGVSSAQSAPFCLLQEVVPTLVEERGLGSKAISKPQQLINKIS